MWADKEIFLQLTDKLEKQDKKLANLNPNNKIFKVRSEYLENQQQEEVFAMFNEKGDLAEDRGSIYEALTAYNENLLSREPHVQSAQELYHMKRETVELLAKTQINEYETLTPREYMRALQKIQAKYKRMFRQFFKLSFKMQAAFYFLFKAMYESERIAEEMLETLLITLHKKGDARDPKNYRFLHIKLDVARIFEMLVYFKLENHFDSKTSECQQGGMKQCDTVENLAMLSSIIVEQEDKKNGLIMTAIDAVKCFDRVHLSDAHAMLQVSGADKKALKVLYQLGAVNKIKVAGGSRSFTITNGETQGGIAAARRTTFMIDEATLRHSRKIPKHLAVIHRGELVNNEGFVDDELLLGFETEAASLAAKLYTNTLDELAMSAHPQKTVQIVTGSETWVTETRAKLEESPSVMQGFNIKTVDQDKYLGMIFASGPYSATLDKNIQAKVTKMKAAASGIRAICNLPAIKRIGKLQAQKLLIMAQITLICLYGMQAWLRVSDAQYEQLEDGFKKAVTTVLSVPSNTNYETLLRQINNFHIRQFSDAIKLKSWNWKLHRKGKGKIVRVLMQEIANGIKTGLAGELEQTCIMYGIPNICLHFLNPNTINFYVKRYSYNLQWRKHMELRSLPLVIHPGKALNWHHHYPYAQGRAYQLYELRLLVLKDTKEWQFPEKFRGDKRCRASDQKAKNLTLYDSSQF